MLHLLSDYGLLQKKYSERKYYEIWVLKVACFRKRSGKTFIGQNCASIPERLIESELFGYEKGAFTDAKEAKKGVFELRDYYLKEIEAKKRDKERKEKLLKWE